MTPRLTGLGHVGRQQPYEAALALAYLSALWQLSQGTGSGAASRVLPHWALYVTDALLGLGGALTLGGLLAVGVATSDVRRVLGRRVEQAGQLLTAGVLAATGIGAFTAGTPGTVPGAVYTALGAAAVTRASMIGRTFAAAGRDRTDLG